MSTRGDFLFLGVSMVPDQRCRSWLHENGPVQIVFALAKLNVTPLQRNQLAFAESRSKSSKEQGIIVGTDFHGSAKKCLGFAQCHRLRLALGGADAGTFARYPAEGALTFRIQRSAQLASWIEIPLRPWRDRT